MANEGIRMSCPSEYLPTALVSIDETYLTCSNCMKQVDFLNIGTSANGTVLCDECLDKIVREEKNNDSRIITGS